MTVAAYSASAGVSRISRTASAIMRGIDEEVIFFGDLVAAPPAKEIFAAFLEKRSPDPAKLHDKK